MGLFDMLGKMLESTNDTSSNQEAKIPWQKLHPFNESANRTTIDGTISLSRFKEIVEKVAESTDARIESVQVIGAVIYITVKARRSSWGTTLNFDDNGQITGNCSISTPYEDSGAVRIFAQQVRDKILEELQ
ncbi:MAG: hypothetical protein IKG82_05405 [Oscillospiraceae bacterium]|nr:hypothetical protein [Oscillospiraceae bacterium]MBR3418110.1 hypothetical protein [Oscillospiraceae bacterium]